MPDLGLNFCFLAGMGELPYTSNLEKVADLDLDRLVAYKRRREPIRTERSVMSYEHSH